MMANTNYTDLMLKDEKQLLIMILEELKDIKTELYAIKLNQNYEKKSAVEEMIEEKIRWDKIMWERGRLSNE